MRKLLILAALLSLLSFTSRAQLYLGGGLGFGKGPENQFAIYIAPEVGCHLTGNFTLGGKLSYLSGWNRFGVDPYVRWNFLKPQSPVRILATVHAPLKFAPDYFSYGFYMQPGISVRLSQSVRLECHVGAFGWGSAKSGSTTVSGWEATINSNTITVGVVVGL